MNLTKDNLSILYRKEEFKVQMRHFIGELVLQVCTYWNQTMGLLVLIANQ